MTNTLESTQQLRTMSEQPMLTLSLALSLGVLSQSPPLHGTVSSPPVPHWVVLLVVVPALWLFIGGAVLVLDRFLQAV